MFFDDFGSRPIYIQPFAPVSKRDVATVRAALSKTFSEPVSVLPSISLPKVAFFHPRKRYRAEKLLAFLAHRPGEKVIGITNVDISTKKGNIYDWGVFGLGSLGGKACVVSTFRLKKHPKFLLNLAKVSIHEVGHTFGLAHCPNKGCLMNDAEGSIKTFESSTGKFCQSCRKKLGAYLRQ